MGLPFLQPFALPRSQDADYRRAFGLSPVTDLEAAKLVSRAYAYHQLTSVGAKKREELAWFPVLVHEVIRARQLDPRATERKLAEVASEKWRQLSAARDGMPSELPTPARIAGVAAMAMLLPGSSTASAFRTAMSAAGTEAALSGGTAWFDAMRSQQVSTEYLRTVESAAGTVAFQSLFWGAAYAEQDPVVRSVLRAYSSRLSLPALESDEEGILQGARQVFPEFRFSPYGDALSGRVDDANAMDAALKSGAASAIEGEQPVNAFRASVRDLVRIADIDETFSYDDWKATIDASASLVRVAAALTGARDPRAAAEINRIGGAAIEMSRGILEYRSLLEKGTLTAAGEQWATLGVYAMAAGIGLELLHGSRSDGTGAALEQVMKQLQAIQEMLVSLYELSQQQFAHMDRRMLSIHSALMAGFDRVDARVAGVERSVASLLVSSVALQEEIDRLRDALTAASESEFEGRYPDAKCMLTARANLTLSARLSLLDECMGLLVQQFAETERSGVLVRGAGVPLGVQGSGQQITAFLDLPQNTLWYAPSRSYPLDVSRLPAQTTTLGALVARLGGSSRFDVPRLNAAHWRQYADYTLRLATANFDLLSRSSVARIAMEDAQTQGRKILSFMNTFSAKETTLPALLLVADAMEESERRLWSELEFTERVYFRAAPRPAAAHLFAVDSGFVNTTIDDPATVMYPCDKAQNDWDARHPLPIPVTTRRAVPQRFRVAEINGNGRLTACYSAVYSDSVSVVWNGNTPNARAYTDFARIHIEVQIDFLSSPRDQPTAPVPVLRHRASTAASVSRHSFGLAKSGCDYRWSFASSRSLGSTEVFASDNDKRENCRKSLRGTVRGLDSHIASTELESGSWAWTQPAIARVPSSVSQGLASARAAVESDAFRLVVSVLSSSPSSSRLAIGSSGRALMATRTLADSTSGPVLSRLALDDVGGIERLTEVELRRSLLIALLETFMPAWKADSGLSAVLMSTDWKTRITDGPFFVSVAQAMGAGTTTSSAPPRNIAALRKLQEVKFARLRESLSRLASEYSTELRSLDAAVVRERVEMLEVLRERAARGASANLPWR